MNFSKIIVSFVIISIGVLTLNNAVAMAQISGIPGVEQVGPPTVGGLVDLVRQIVRWAYIIFFIIAVLMIILAAFSYLTAGGDAEKVNTAKNRLIYAAVAIAVAFLAVSFETIIKNFLSASGA